MIDNSKRFFERYRTLFRTIFILALAGFLTFSALLSFVLFGAHDKIEGEPELMMILGCQVHSWGPSVLLQDRLDTALDYLEDHPDMTVVVTGGQGPDEPTSEARAMADYLTAHGIAPAQILLEEDSHNTKENFELSAQLLREHGYDLTEEILVVSNDFHLTRARLLAYRMDYKNVSALAAPASHLPSKLKMYIREPLALMKSMLFDRPDRDMLRSAEEEYDAG